jgi:hypothetical protein
MGMKKGMSSYLYARAGGPCHIDARNYNAKETLKNGIVVTIRAIRPDDKENIAKAFSNLDRKSVYTRFFRYKNKLTDDETSRNRRPCGNEKKRRG